jgi:hypothetical protein
MSTHEYRLIASTKSPEDLVRHDRVDVSLYNDPALFEAELERFSTAPGCGSPTKAKCATPVTSRPPPSAVAR